MHHLNDMPVVLCGHSHTCAAEDAIIPDSQEEEEEEEDGSSGAADDAGAGMFDCG